MKLAAAASAAWRSVWPGPTMHLLIALCVFIPGGGNPAAQISSLDRECLAHRTSSHGSPGTARFVPDQVEERFEPRSAALSRRVLCGFRAGSLVSASEQFYLQIVSRDRNNPGFTTASPKMSSRFFIVCEGGMRTTLPAFEAGQRLSFAANTFTLPCGHALYPEGTREPAEAQRISGVYSYKVQSATLEVRKGPTLEQPEFDVALDVLVKNPVESVRLRGELSGRLATTYTIVYCPTAPRNTRQEPPPGCR